MIVVQGSAIIIPTTPISAPQMERERRMMAGFNPVIRPIILGTIIASWIACTIQNTNRAAARIHQKFSPVSAAFSKASKTVGTRAISCKYGTMFNRPMKSPKPTASGKSMMTKPMLNNTPTKNATSACPRN